MSFLDSVKNVGSNFIHSAENFGSEVVNDAKKVGSTIVNDAKKVGSTFVHDAETAGKALVKGTEAGTHAAVQTLKFEANMTRFGLEKALDGAKKVGSTVKDAAAGAVNRMTHPGDPHPPDAQGLKFSESKGASQLAYKKEGAKPGDVYQFPDGKKWQVADVKDDPKSGFRAVALKSLDPNDKRVIVAFSGTDEGKDWTKANIPNQFGIPTKQYSQAVEFAKKWQASDGANVRLTGHSLGGGLASFASIKTGIPATGINSASLAINRQGNIFTQKNNITQYYVPGEALSTKIGRIGFAPSRPGNQIAVQGKDSILDPRSVISNHGLDHTAPDVPFPVKVK